jgi:hypothetical protein
VSVTDGIFLRPLDGESGLSALFEPADGIFFSVGGEPPDDDECDLSRYGWMHGPASGRGQSESYRLGAGGGTAWSADMAFFTGGRAEGDCAGLRAFTASTRTCSHHIGRQAQMRDTSKPGDADLGAAVGGGVVGFLSGECVPLQS